MEGDFHEVVLTLSVTVKNGDEVAFIAEVQQAGIFLIKNLDASSMSHTLGAFCPNILFPYARETLDSLVTRGSFPALMLSPVNFDALSRWVARGIAGATAVSAQDAQGFLSGGVLGHRAAAPGVLGRLVVSRQSPAVVARRSQQQAHLQTLRQPSHHQLVRALQQVAQLFAAHGVGGCMMIQRARAR